MSSNARELEDIECRLARIEGEILKLLNRCDTPVVRSLGLTAGAPVPIKPPAQGIGVSGIDQSAVGAAATPALQTHNMREIKDLIHEPHVRLLLMREAKVDPPEQVQHQRVLCERIVLAGCGAKSYPELAHGEPAAKLTKLVARLNVFNGGF